MRANPCTLGTDILPTYFTPVFICNFTLLFPGRKQNNLVINNFISKVLNEGMVGSSWSLGWSRKLILLQNSAVHYHIQKILPLDPYSEPVRELYLELGLHNIMIIHRMTVTQNKVQQMVFILLMWLLAKPLSSEIQLYWGTCVQITLIASISTFLTICHHNQHTTCDMSLYSTNHGDRKTATKHWEHPGSLCSP
jgi:hypothetical protein